MRRASCPLWLTTAWLGWLAVVPAVAHAEAPLAIKGAELAIRWPQLLGKTVQISVTPVQALDAARYYVKVDKLDAVMVMMPDKVWSGRKTVCAMVLGPEKVHRGGRTQVVGLMWKGCGVE